MNNFKTHHPVYRWSFLSIGIIATLSYRAIIVVNRYSLLWSDILWYIGTIGFGIYFMHRYQIDNRREQTIKNDKLISKIQGVQSLSKSDRQEIVEIFKSLSGGTAKWNYMVIFVVSLLALSYDLVLRLMAI